MLTLLFLPLPLPLPLHPLPSTLLPNPDLFEEHALLMGRLGRHEAALAIYAHILKDHDLALQ